MSVYSQASKADRNKIRRQMIAQAEHLLVDSYPSRAQLKAVARSIVDQALAKERNEAIDSSTKRPS